MRYSQYEDTDGQQSDVVSSSDQTKLNRRLAWRQRCNYVSWQVVNSVGNLTEKNSSRCGTLKILGGQTRNRSMSLFDLNRRCRLRFLPGDAVRRARLCHSMSSVVCLYDIVQVP